MHSDMNLTFNDMSAKINADNFFRGYARLNTFANIRKAKGYTAAKLCYEADISNSTVARIERGDAVSMVTAGVVCEKLGLAIDVDKPLAPQFARYGIKVSEVEKKRGGK